MAIFWPTPGFKGFSTLRFRCIGVTFFGWFWLNDLDFLFFEVLGSQSFFRAIPAFLGRRKPDLFLTSSQSTKLAAETTHSLVQHSMMWSQYEHVTRKAPMFWVTSNGGVGFLSDLWSGSITSDEPTVAELDILHWSEDGDAVWNQYKPHNRRVKREMPWWEIKDSHFKSDHTAGNWSDHSSKEA